MPRAKRQAAPQAPQDDFTRSVLEGLSRPAKSLPCRFLYDAAGGALFEEITRQPEYYLTRAEIEILDSHAAQMLGLPVDGKTLDSMTLVEFGSGSSRKTEILLRAAQGLRAYAPIDISDAALEEAAARLAARFPRLDIRPLCADFSRPLLLPADLAARPKLGFFPGSTIGNFAPPDAARLLAAMRETLSGAARLLVGVDLRKDARRLVAAYDDAKGVTAAFNLNLLARLNRELGADFDLAAFRHEATYDPVEGRIDMRLVSLKDQFAQVADRRFVFRAGEAIHTEHAYKYTIAGFQRVAVAAGWRPLRVWTDREALFSVHELGAP